MKAVWIYSIHWDLLYSEYASINLNSSCLTVVSTSWLILWKGKLSLGKALFKPMKSWHVCHFSLLFGTKTGLYTQTRYWASWIKPFSNNLYTLFFKVSYFLVIMLSSLHFKLNLGINFQGMRCPIGIYSHHITYFQSNTSRFNVMKLFSNPFIGSLNSLLIFRTLLVSSKLTKRPSSFSIAPLLTTVCYAGINSIIDFKFLFEITHLN